MKSSYITPSITLFRSDGLVDLDAMQSHFEFLIRGGVNGILILGSIGEFFSIGVEEKKKLITCAVQTIKKRVQLIVGTTSMLWEEIVELSDFAQKAGADACIILPPYYFPLSENRIFHYFDSLAKALKNQKIYLYNFPDRTGYAISTNVILKLLQKHDNIIGIKDTQSGMGNTINLIQQVKMKYPSFEVYSGFDDNFVHNVLAGGDGCIGGLSNLIPDICHRWVKAVQDENFMEISEIQKKINGLMDIYNIGVPFVPYIKAALAVRGAHLNFQASFPLMEASDSEKKKIEEILTREKIEKLEGIML